MYQAIFNIYVLLVQYVSSTLTFLDGICKTMSYLDVIKHVGYLVYT